MRRIVMLLFGFGWAAEPLQQSSPGTTIPQTIVRAARKQVGTSYSPGYVRLTFPGGDLPKDKGVCTDVIVRALRAAGYDLQVLINSDMKRHFDKYPKQWGLTRPDPNIDHRRVPNQMKFFERHGKSLPLQTDSARIKQWQAGDFVYWRLDSSLLHCGVVSDRQGASGLPLVIHNLGGCAEEDCLTTWKIIGHYRYPAGKVTR